MMVFWVFWLFFCCAYTGYMLNKVLNSKTTDSTLDKNWDAMNLLLGICSTILTLVKFI